MNCIILINNSMKRTCYTLSCYSLENDTNFDRRIAELAEDDCYARKVHMLSCTIGIRTHTALALVVETGDFHRFQKAEQYASFLGLVPGERSSSDNQNRLSITKAGNSHLRRLLT
ncbi:MAG: IS110 family transposase [Selenomonadaceae bacterium]|nr:IS110 family transposase [Selenomonadaceae bacterium]